MKMFMSIVVVVIIIVQGSYTKDNFFLQGQIFSTIFGNAGVSVCMAWLHVCQALNQARIQGDSSSSHTSHCVASTVNMDGIRNPSQKLLRVPTGIGFGSHLLVLQVIKNVQKYYATEKKVFKSASRCLVS
jgi:hypothetical protein